MAYHRDQRCNYLLFKIRLKKKKKKKNKLKNDFVFKFISELKLSKEFLQIE
jgi:hypothetical protein